MSDTDRHKHAREIAHRYTDAERERALFAVALCSGNCERAAQGLAEHDEKYPAPDARTLRRWKAQLLRGEPTEIKQNRSSAEILRTLEEKYGVEVVPSTAEDVTDAEVVGETPEG